MHSTRRQAQFATENVRINEIPFARAEAQFHAWRTTGLLDHRHRCQSLHSIVVKVHNGCLQGLRVAREEVVAESRKGKLRRGRGTTEVCGVAIFLSNRHRAIPYAQYSRTHWLGIKQTEGCLSYPERETIEEDRGLREREKFLSAIEFRGNAILKKFLNKIFYNTDN